MGEREKERFFFMQLVIQKGIVLTIDDDEIERWAYELDPVSNSEKKDYYIWLKNGAKLCYFSSTKEVFII
jgi:hypothetical protein